MTGELASNILRSQYLTVSRQLAGIMISYNIPWTMTLGLVSRNKELRRKLKAKLIRWRASAQTEESEKISALFVAQDADTVMPAIKDIDRMLDNFAKQRLTPKMVEDILGISSGERIRWTKDGRLSKSDTGTFRKGRQIFQFYLHPVKEIADLAANTAIIEGWRRADAVTSRLHRGETNAHRLIRKPHLV